MQTAKQLFSTRSFVTLFVVALLFPLSAARAEKKDGLLGPVLLGPKLTAGVPIPFRVGLEGKVGPLFGFGFDYGFFPSLEFDQVSVSANSWSIAARVYPFQESFYLGAAFGKQSLEGSNTQSVSGAGISGSPVVTTTGSYDQVFIAPQLGWRWVWDSGFFLGMELGVQIPVSSTLETTITVNDGQNIANTPEVQALLSDAVGQADNYGNRMLPWIGLIQFGFFL